MDYLRYWSLRRKPFLFAKGDDFFAGVPQREALAGLSYFVGSSERTAMLVCPPNNGLSWLLSHTGLMRGFGDQAVELILTPGHFRDLAGMQIALCQAMGFESPGHRAADKLAAALRGNDRRDVRLVWLMDGSQSESAAIAVELSQRYQNFSVVFGCTITAAQKMPIKLRREATQIELLPLTIDDSCEYVKFCLDRAGAPSPLISDNTVVRLHELAGGSIGSLGFAAESSLALAASHQFDRVTPAVVEAFDQRFRRAA